MDEEDQLEVQAGTSLATIALLTALITGLREKGLLSRSEVGAVFDVALIGAEEAPIITPTANRQARVLLEMLAVELCGQRE